jgi:hypothetical protein
LKINAKERFGNTAYNYACSNSLIWHNQIDLIGLLLDNGALIPTVETAGLEKTENNGYIAYGRIIPFHMGEIENAGKKNETLFSNDRLFVVGSKRSNEANNDPFIWKVLIPLDADITASKGVGVTVNKVKLLEIIKNKTAEKKWNCSIKEYI